jgi:phospholipid/cholesterol/gamma-HCH transport system ATP-binding protein
MDQPILELRDATVVLDGDRILDKINLKIWPKETAVFIGMSGSGKTVLLKTLAGLITPTSGSLKYKGREWLAISHEERHQIARQIGMQFQQGALYDDVSVFENVAWPLREHETYSESAIEQRVRECLQLVNLEEYETFLPHELSGGMRLRLGVARAIALSPEVLFMDDPTAGLDPVRSDEMAQLILDLKSQIGATLVVVTHDIARAYQFAGRIFLIANKAVIETGSEKETRDSPDARVQQFLHGWQRGPLTDSGAMVG